MTESFDLIILDVILPDFDGWRILQSLREADRSVPLLFLTARDSVDDRVKGLKLAKADNGLYQPNSVDVDLATEIQNLFEYYEAWAEERNVSLELEGDATMSGDRLMLTRALGNLLSNAIKHTPQGETVRVRLKQASAQVISVSIENPGPAIPAEHLPKLFDRFYRVDASRQRGNDGAGLGLAIAKSIIDIHNGKIEATSNETNTQFRITLPQAALS